MVSIKFFLFFSRAINRLKCQIDQRGKVPLYNGNEHKQELDMPIAGQFVLQVRLLLSLCWSWAQFHRDSTVVLKCHLNSCKQFKPQVATLRLCCTWHPYRWIFFFFRVYTTTQGLRLGVWERLPSPSQSAVVTSCFALAQICLVSSRRLPWARRRRRRSCWQRKFTPVRWRRKMTRTPCPCSLWPRTLPSASSRHWSTSCLRSWLSSSRRRAPRGRPGFPRGWACWGLKCFPTVDACLGFDFLFILIALCSQQCALKQLSGNVSLVIGQWYWYLSNISGEILSVSKLPCLVPFKHADSF